MKTAEIAARCYREIKNSTSLPMLMTAYRYYWLFVNHLTRKRVDKEKLQKIDWMILRVFKRKRKELTKI